MSENGSDLEMMRYKESEVGDVDQTETENLKPGKKSPAFSNRFYSNAYTVTNFSILVVLVVGIVVLISVTSATFDKVDNMEPTTTVTTAYASLGLPGYEGYSWDDVTTKSEGSSVNFWMWGGDKQINAWVTGWLAPHVKDEYDITLNLVKLNDTKDAVNQILNEYKDGNLTTGQVDLVWINGENYNTLKSANALYGPFANKVPASANFDFESDMIKYDFGRTTNGYEMPYNLAQVVFIYDKKRFPATGPPKTMDELLTWVSAVLVLI